MEIDQKPRIISAYKEIKFHLKVSLTVVDSIFKILKPGASKRF